MVESSKAESEKKRPPSEPRAPQWVPYVPPKPSLLARLRRAARRYAFPVALLFSLAAVVGVLFLYTPLQERWGNSENQMAPAATTDPPPTTSSNPYAGETVFSVASQPAGAEVVLGTDTLGTTPLEQHATRAGAYVLSVHKEGYAAVDSVVFLRSNQPLALRFQLTPEERAATGSASEEGMSERKEGLERKEAGGEEEALPPPAERAAVAEESSARAAEREADEARRAEQRRAERYRALRAEADRLFAQRKFEAAIEHYKAALRHRPGDAYATGRIQESRKRERVVGW